MSDSLTEQPVKTLHNADVVAALSDITGANTLEIDSGNRAWTLATQGPAAALSAAWPFEMTDGTNILGTSTHPVRIDPTGTTTQPVSGTVTANQGSPNSLANAWPVELSDGTNLLGTQAHPLIVEQANEAGAGTPVDSGSMSHSALAPGLSATINFAAVTNGKTGYLKSWGASSSVPIKAILQKNISAAATDLRTRFTSASNPSIGNADFDNNELQIVGNGTDFWQVTITNMDDKNTANVYTDAVWMEI
jgi:hypothetical protein